jgi:hypothetical protein
MFWKGNRRGRQETVSGGREIFRRLICLFDVLSPAVLAILYGGFRLFTEGQKLRIERSLPVDEILRAFTKIY